MSLTERLRDRAAEHPGRIAIVDPSGGETRRITYEILWDRVCRGAGFLSARGMKPGDAILVIHPITIELYEVLLSAIHAGLTVVMLDPAQGGRLLEQCLGRVGPKIFFASPKAHLLRIKYSCVRRIRRRMHTGRWVPISERWDVESAVAVREPADVAADHPALVTFTSGSTGVPKGVARSHGFLLAQSDALGACLDLGEGEVDLVTLPVFLLANLAHGLTSVIADTDLTRPGNPDVGRLLLQVQRENPTRCTASPAFFEALLGCGDIFRSLRKIYTGGAPVFPRLLRQLAEAHPEIAAYAVYGSSEAEPIAHLSAGEIGPGWGAKIREGGGLPAGKPVAVIQLAILEDRWGRPLGPMTLEAFRDLTTPVGMPGEILVSGDHVLRGYLAGIGDETTKVKVGDAVWHRTGDAGYVDGEGILWLLGRCSAALRNREPMVYPLQVEAAISEVSGVTRSACVCHGSETLLVVEGPASALPRVRDMVAWARIDRVVRMDRIPVDARHNAKVDYAALAKMLQGS